MITLTQKRRAVVTSGAVRVYFIGRQTRDEVGLVAHENSAGDEVRSW